MTLAELELRVKTQLRAEMGTPALNNLHDDSIKQWANEEVYNVIIMLGDPQHFPSLNAIDTSLTFSSGKADLPSDFWLPKNEAKTEKYIEDFISLKVTANSVTKRNVVLLSPGEFARQDSSNFVLTPTTIFPAGMIADQVYIKPTSITAGYLDFITTHQTISDSLGTEFDELGDNVLVRLVMARFYEFREFPDLQGQALSFAEKLVKGE